MASQTRDDSLLPQKRKSEASLPRKRKCDACPSTLDESQTQAITSLGALQKLSPMLCTDDRAFASLETSLKEGRRVRICKVHIRVADGRQKHGGLDGKKMSLDPESPVAVRLQRRQSHQREHAASREYKELRSQAKAAIADKRRLEQTNRELRAALEENEKRLAYTASRASAIAEHLNSLKTSISRELCDEIDELVRQLEEGQPERPEESEDADAQVEPMDAVIDPMKLTKEDLAYFYWFRTLESLKEFIKSVPVSTTGRKHDHTARVLMALLHMRRGYGLRAIGFFFGVSKSTVSRVLRIMLPQLATAAVGPDPLPRLFDPETAALHVPPGHCFIPYKCKIVTDGTYFYFDQPEQGKAQRGMFTKNKGRHCHKFLVMCYSDGTLIDVVGPCGNDTDEKMFLDWVVRNKAELQEFFKDGGAIVADRGFRGSQFQTNVLKALSCTVAFPIPASKLNGQQRLEVVNYSKMVASERSQVEQLNARAKMECKILDKRKLKSTVIEHIKSIVLIAYFLSEKIDKPFYDATQELPATLTWEPHVTGVLPVDTGPPSFTPLTNRRPSQQLRDVVKAALLQNTCLFQVDKGADLYTKPEDALALDGSLLALVKSLETNLKNNSSPATTASAPSSVSGAATTSSDSATTSSDSATTSSDSATTSSSTASAEDRRSALLQLTVQELKGKCAAQGLSRSGRKSALVDRLLNPHHPASRPTSTPALIPCKQFLLWAALARTGFLGGTLLTPNVARQHLPKFTREAVIALLNSLAPVSVNPTVSPGVKRAERTFFRGENHHVGDVVYYAGRGPKGQAAVLLCTNVTASMQDDAYHSYLLFEYEGVASCSLVRSYCECHYGFSVQCGHKASLLLHVGYLQGAYVKKHYSTEAAVDKHRRKYE